MLYLHPPFHTIDGVSLARDHADERQWYYMPLSPQLTLRDDAATGQRIPSIQLIKFGGEAADGTMLSGGFLDFDCHLGLEQDRLDSIAAQLQGLEGLSDLPRLAPVPLVDGTVKMMLFGRVSETEEDDDPLPPLEEEAPERFVVKMVHHAKPSLYGNNQAAFSVELDQEGVTILEQALQGEMAPIGIVYSLEYVALRPAYEVTVTADWERVQTHIEETEKVNVPFIYSHSIDEVVDELVEDRAIVIEGTLEVAEGDGDAEIGRYEDAMEAVRAMVTDAFFEPSLEPMPRADGTIDDLEEIGRGFATGGLGQVYERREIDLTRIDRKSLNATFSERTAVIRRIHPQGHLTGIARVIEQQGLDLDDFILQVKLGDDFFKRRTMRVIPRVAWARDQVVSINVALEYDDDVQNVVLEPDAEDDAGTEEQVDWPSALVDGVMQQEVTVSYTVNFDPNQVTGRPLSLRSEPVVLTGDVLEVSPRGDGLYEVMYVTFTSTGFPFERYPNVEVSCRYRDPENGIEVSDTYGLSAAADGNGSAWPVFLVDPTRRTFEYRLVMHGADGRNVDTGWIQADDATIPVRDPFAQRHEVQIVTSASHFESELERAFVDVTYDDPANSVFKQESFEFSSEQHGTATFSVELVDTEKRVVTYDVTLLFRDGRTITIPSSSTRARRIMVNPRMRGHRSVRVVAASDPAAAGVETITVDLSYIDDAAGLRFTEQLHLQEAGDEGLFEYDVADPGADSFTYALTYRHTNGLTRSVAPRPADGSVLLVDVD